jgi:hypothetical protein
MELFASDNQRIADFSTNDKDDNLLAFNIVQNTQIADTQFVFGKRVWPQALDRAGWGSRLLRKSREDGRFQDSLLPGR